MSIETYICVKQTANPNMGGMECWSSENCIFLVDKNSWVNIGDKVECERGKDGFYKRIWVNGELKKGFEIYTENK